MRAKLVSLRSKKICVLCRANQVRSILITSAITKRHPELVVYSAGTQAIQGSRIPAITTMLAESFGFSVESETPKNITEVETNFANTDLFLIADAEVYKDSRNKVTQSAAVQIIGHNITSRPGVDDPIGLSVGETGNAVSRAIFYSFHSIYKFFQSEKNYPGITVCFFTKSSNFNEIVDKSISLAKLKNANLFIGDLISPVVKNLNISNATLHLIDFKSAEDLARIFRILKFNTPKEVNILSSKYEVLNPLGLPFEGAFRDFIFGLAELSELIIVTGPIDLNPKLTQFSYLLASYGNGDIHFW